MMLLAQGFATLAMLAGPSFPINAMVLQKGDFAKGFQQTTATGIVTNKAAGAASPELASMIRRWGRMIGYQAVFHRGNPFTEVESLAVVYRTRVGASAA